MGLSQRLRTLLGAKFSKLLDKYDDPRQSLDYSFEKQKELLANVKKGIVQLTAAKKELEAQKQKLSADIARYDSQAKEAMQQNNENFAKAALERKVKTQEDLNSVTNSINNLKKEQEKLVETQDILEQKIEQLKTRKETLKAEYSAAKASSEIKESLSGIGSEVGNIGDAMERVKDKTEAMNAKSGAIDELVENGVLSEAGEKTDKIERELNKVSSQNVVNNELNKMKRISRLKRNDLNAFALDKTRADK